MNKSYELVKKTIKNKIPQTTIENIKNFPPSLLSNQSTAAAFTTKNHKTNISVIFTTISSFFLII